MCGFDANVQSCVDTGGDALTLAVGQYEFLYLYFEAGGGSSGEMFYAAGRHEAFDADEFVLVGDASKGIGVTADGITGTTYKSAADAIGDINKAVDLILGFVDQQEGFPASALSPPPMFTTRAELDGLATIIRFRDWSILPSRTSPTKARSVGPPMTVF